MACHGCYCREGSSLAFASLQLSSTLYSSVCVCFVNFIAHICHPPPSYWELDPRSYHSTTDLYPHTSASRGAGIIGLCIRAQTAQNFCQKPFQLIFGKRLDRNVFRAWSDLSPTHVFSAPSGSPNIRFPTVVTQPRAPNRGYPLGDTAPWDVVSIFTPARHLKKFGQPCFPHFVLENHFL